MSAGNPAWEKVAATVIARNNELRAKLGLKERKDSTPNWQALIEEVRRNNEVLEAELEKVKKVVKKVNNPKKVNKKKETGKKEE